MKQDKPRDLTFIPSEKTLNKASSVIKLMDEAKGMLLSTPKMVSKLAKNIKTINPAVPRYFESPNQISSYFAEGEYDLTSLFKLLKHEAYFMKSVQKKLALIMKSGVTTTSDNDEMGEYLSKRFMVMQLQTGLSLSHIIKQVCFYLLVCSNCWIIKVRDKDCEIAQSYQKDGKDMHPVVGLFIPHPTTIKPRFKYVQRGKFYEMVLDKWIYLSVRRGIIKEFEPEDVVHFSLYKEDGMVLGTPEVLSVVDDIRTLRKIEEDIQLLIYRDLFPIIHYKVEQPGMIDHTVGISELDKAKQDLERLTQEGGIATDARHTIEYVGQRGAGLDVSNYLKYFQERVFSGLGVSAADMGIGSDISGNTANSMSKQLTDMVRFVQQEVAEQFNEKILLEFAIQSGIDGCLDLDNLPRLEFTEIDLEWQIRKENHHADLFTKGVLTLDEARKTTGRKEASEEDIDNTYHGIYEKPQLEVENELAEKQVQVARIAKSASSSTSKAKSRAKSSSKKSAADKDIVKSSKSNSNIVKSNRDSLCIQDAYITYIQNSKSDTKLKAMSVASLIYNKIQYSMQNSILDGMEQASKDLGIKDYDNSISHNIYEQLDSFKESLIDIIKDGSISDNRISARINTASNTRCNNAYP